MAILTSSLRQEKFLESPQESSTTEKCSRVAGQQKEEVNLETCGEDALHDWPARKPRTRTIDVKIRFWRDALGAGKQAKQKRSCLISADLPVIVKLGTCIQSHHNSPSTPEWPAQILRLILRDLECKAAHEHRADGKMTSRAALSSLPTPTAQLRRGAGIRCVVPSSRWIDLFSNFSRTSFCTLKNFNM